MVKLRYGYVLTGIFTGIVLLYSFFTTLPDGKLHIVFCDVGQGDATYVQFADGRDMLVDGGPNDNVLSCLGRHMPFWDKTINLVVLTHPQKDHAGGLASVLERYNVEYFLKSDVESDIESYTKLKDLLSTKNTQVKLVDQGQTITIGATSLLALWPSKSQIALGARLKRLSEQLAQVKGASTDVELNDYSVVLWLRYGAFDAILPGDADSHVQPEIAIKQLAVDEVEVLKVPHHGSKTAMTDEFIDTIFSFARPGLAKLAVISVGKNSYGHPAEETITMLEHTGARVIRTDQQGDIEVISDGKNWEVKK
jgi:competence protein ComEC